MMEKPKVVSLKNYRYRRYYQNLQRERGKNLAGLLCEQHGYEERNENTSHGRKVRQIEPTQVD